MSVVSIAQQTILHKDTFNAAHSATVVSNDDLLLQLIEAQSRELKLQNDSIEHIRLLTDTTTAFPFHIGYADSIRIAKYGKCMSKTYPLAQKPLLYIPSKRLTFTAKRDSDVNIGTIRQCARTYIATHHAELFDDIFQPEIVKDIIVNEKEVSDYYSRERYIIKDEHEDSIYLRKIIREKYSPWKKESTLMLQLSQNYVTKNWHEGGSSMFALLGMFQGSINYDDKDRITWDNTGEWRLGFNTTSDTLRKVNTNEDILKLYSKFGYRIFNKVSYSFSANFETHFFNTWKTNTKEIKTGPLTPIKLNIATGLDYRPVDGLSIYFAPLTYKMVYANDTVHASQTAYGIKEGKKILNDVGSSLRVDWSWQPLREIDLTSKFYLYTNYRRVEIDWEIACNFIITRYISTFVMLHPRYDTTAILPDDTRAKIQFKELISIGFTHKFR
ncbi:MAG: DUF3078 domain-containing protein [Paludibacteraceae bacterium]|nr:DUF3078 domain-containing protein [Paludibacteraceae bacterium]